MAGNLLERYGMKKINIITLSAFSIISLFTSCSEEQLLKPYGPNDGKAPGKVEIVSYTSIPGGVEVNYTPPTDEDLMYVKVAYTLDTGEKKEVNVSAYSNKFVVEGFGNENPKTLTLSAVDRHENEGEAIKTEVIPGKPSYLKAYETLTTSDAFGGVSVFFENPDFKPLIVDILTQDEEDRWYVAHTEYTPTSKKDVKFAIRGYDIKPRTFKMVVRDSWDNVSDTLSSLITPLFEVQIPRDGFRRYVLPTDLSVDAWGLNMEQLWSGVVDWNSYNMCHSDNFENFPQWFTFDMGVKAKLSRYRYWQRLNEDLLYKHGNMKTWEIWGHPGTPPSDGSWDGWILLHESESLKPSGLPVGSITQEDIDYAKKGEDFEFSLESPAVRYIRVKATMTFSKERFIHIQQFWFWGAPESN